MNSEIITYRDMCSRERRNSLQRGMHFKINKNYSVVLMSRTPNAPYKDEVKPDGVTLIYEGHDIPRSPVVDNPKLFDQPGTSRKGSMTQNGLFDRGAQNYKLKKHDAEKVRVYEKIKPNVWVYNGLFKLTDSWVKPDEHRNVFKFQLELQLDNETKLNKTPEIGSRRIIPSKVKYDVWKRDKGKCVKCESQENLRFDQNIPFSKNIISMTTEHVQILCVKHK